MSKQGIEQAESIRDSITCLKCDYSLRGLMGDIVTCPECGERVNIAAVVIKHWTGPWYRAPLYNVLALSAVWAFVVFVIAGLSMIAHESQPIALPIVAVSLIVSASVWLALLFNSTRKFGSNEGFFLALLLHLLFVGYIVGIVGIIVGMIVIVSDEIWDDGLIFICVTFVVCIGIIAATRMGEKFVAARCIRQHVRKIGKV